MSWDYRTIKRGEKTTAMRRTRALQGGFDHYKSDKIGEHYRRRRTAKPTAKDPDTKENEVDNG